MTIRGKARTSTWNKRSAKPGNQRLSDRGGNALSAGDRLQQSSSKQLKFKKNRKRDDMRAVAEGCPAMRRGGRKPPAAAFTPRYGNKEMADVNFYGQTPRYGGYRHAAIVESGRYFHGGGKRAPRWRFA